MKPTQLKYFEQEISVQKCLTQIAANNLHLKSLVGRTSLWLFQSTQFESIKQSLKQIRRPTSIFSTTDGNLPRKFVTTHIYILIYSAHSTIMLVKVEMQTLMINSTYFSGNVSNQQSNLDSKQKICEFTDYQRSKNFGQPSIFNYSFSVTMYMHIAYYGMSLQ